MNLNTFLLIDGSLMLIGLPLLMILKSKNWSKNFSTFYPYSNSIVDPLSVYGSTSNRTYLFVGGSVWLVRTYL